MSIFITFCRFDAARALARIHIKRAMYAKTVDYFIITRIPTYTLPAHPRIEQMVIYLYVMQTRELISYRVRLPRHTAHSWSAIRKQFTLIIGTLRVQQQQQQ